MSDPASPVVKTYRYLRIAMISLLVALGLAVLHEMNRVDWACFQTSISAYYYTPAQAVFVGTLIAVGVCMVAIKGNTEREDVLLNVGGMLAPVVALVPTPGPGDCRSVAVTAFERSANVANNMTALLGVGVLALVATAVIGTADHRRGGTRWAPGQLAGLAASAALVAFTAYVFHAERALFLDKAHYTAAIAMFGCIWLVVLVNAKTFSDERTADPRTLNVSPYTNRYAVLAAIMAASGLGMGAVAWLGSWEHAVLWIEIVQIGCFAWFWVLQTYELWNEGFRRNADGERPHSRLNARLKASSDS